MENIALTFNVLEYCRHNQLPLIFASSREVYGDIRRYITEETHADFSYTESPYSASKVAGEALVYSYARCYGVPYIVFRFSNVYGRYDNDIRRMERVIPLFIERMRAGLPVTVFGQEKMLDFTYVDDCVDGIVAGIERLAAGAVQNQTINLAYGQGNTLVRMAEFIANALGVAGQIEVEPAKRVGEVTRYIADISKAAELLGYQPKVPLDEGTSAARWRSAPGRPRNSVHPSPYPLPLPEETVCGVDAAALPPHQHRQNTPLLWERKGVRARHEKAYQCMIQRRWSRSSPRRSTRASSSPTRSSRCWRKTTRRSSTWCSTAAHSTARWRILRGYGARVRWLSEPDGGQADALNKGFATARGSIVAWLNADDRYLPGAVSCAVAALQAHPRPRWSTARPSSSTGPGA